MPKSTKTISISLDDEVIEKGRRQAARRGFKHSFSAFIANLIEQDSARIAATPDREFLNQPANGEKEPAHA